jgi:hypothetical protein
VLGELIIFGENILLELKRARYWLLLMRMTVRFVMIVVMLMSFVRVIMMMVAVVMAVIGVRVADVVIAGEHGQARFGTVGASAGGTHLKLPRLIESSIPVR